MLAGGTREQNDEYVEVLDGGGFHSVLSDDDEKVEGVGSSVKSWKFCIPESSHGRQFPGSKTIVIRGCALC